MGAKESFPVFERFIEDSHKSIVSQLDKLIRYIVSANSSSDVTARCKELDTSLETLFSVLSRTDYPDWSVALRSATQCYASDKNAYNLMMKIIKVHETVCNYDWRQTLGSTKPGIDFGETFWEEYSNSRIPQLFDQLLEALENIVTSGCVDSRYAVQSLELLIETIKKNKAPGNIGGLQFARLGSKFFKHFSLELLKGIPVIRPFVVAAENTLKELEAESSQLNLAYADTMSSKVHEYLPLRPAAIGALPAPQDESATPAERLSAGSGPS